MAGASLKNRFCFALTSLSSGVQQEQQKLKYFGAHVAKELLNDMVFALVVVVALVWLARNPARFAWRAPRCLRVEVGVGHIHRHLSCYAGVKLLVAFGV